MSFAAETELRGLIRELIREVLPEIGGSPEVRDVRITNDAELADFVATILELATNSAEVERVRSGQLRFALTRPSGPDSGSEDGQSAVDAKHVEQEPVSTPRQVIRIDKGAVTERIVSRVIAADSRLLLGRGAVVTPLARELARKNNLVLERAS